MKRLILFPYPKSLPWQDKFLRSADQSCYQNDQSPLLLGNTHLIPIRKAPENQGPFYIVSSKTYINSILGFAPWLGSMTFPVLELGNKYPLPWRCGMPATRWRSWW